jgi:hypothetical protein
VAYRPPGAGTCATRTNTESALSRAAPAGLTLSAAWSRARFVSSAGLPVLTGPPRDDHQLAPAGLAVSETYPIALRERTSQTRRKSPRPRRFASGS